MSRVRILRTGGFGRLWVSQLQSDLGTWLLVVAVPVYVFQVTRSPVGTGLAFVAETAPALVFAPFAGLLADRLDRRLIMACSDALRALCVLSMLLVAGRGQIWLVYVAVFAENTFAQFFDPAYYAIVPAIVGRGDDLVEATAWSAASTGIVRLAGGPLGGFLYALIGFHGLVLADAGTYLLSALLVVSLRARRPAGRDYVNPKFLNELLAGVRFLSRQAVLRGLLVVSALFLFANGALNVVIVPLTVQVLHGGSRDVGLLMAALGAGYLAGAWLGRRASARGWLRLPVTACLAGVALAFAGLFNASVMPVALVSIALAGVCGGTLLPVIGVQVRRHTPDAILGRTSSAMAAVQMAASLAGGALGGVLAGTIGIAAMADLALAPILVAAVLAWATLPRSAGPHPAGPPPAVAAIRSG